tara:strand:- start:310 stop:795 length:486 start_codon:yes stop_codon:yes gene_type:complete
MLKYLKKNFVTNLLIIIIVFSLDRISKFYVVFKSETILSSNLFSSKFLNINLIWNEGIAFGLLSFDQKLYYNILTLLIVLVTLIIIFFMFKSKGLEKVSYSIIIGGSLGNITDRLYYSAVPDFIDIYIYNFHWFIFNVADIFISFGVLLLVCLELFLKKRT